MKWSALSVLANTKKMLMDCTINCYHGQLIPDLTSIKLGNHSQKPTSTSSLFQILTNNNLMETVVGCLCLKQLDDKIKAWNIYKAGLDEW